MTDVPLPPVFDEAHPFHLMPEELQKCLDIAHSVPPERLQEAAHNLQTAIAQAKTVEEILSVALLISSKALKIAVAV